MPDLSFSLAAPEHFDAIIVIERASHRSSPISLIGVPALREALDRGHWVVVALDGAAVAGWIWFSIDLDRGGEYTGQIFRIGVDHDSRREGVATALLEHARSVLASRDVVRIRAVLDGTDPGARAFFEAAGFAPASITMERPL